MTVQQTPNVPTPALEAPLPVELELLLGLGPEDAELVVTPKARRLDLHPWLLDCVAVQVRCLGHQDEVPRAWDWENVLTLLEPGEELLYVLDHVRSRGAQTGSPFTLWLAIRFPQGRELSSMELDRRKKRARMLVSQFQRQAFPGSDLRWVDPRELQNFLGFSTGNKQSCIGLSGLPSPRNIEDDQREVERGSATRNYQSLNDVAESLVDVGCNYRIAFVIERVGTEALKRRLGMATQLRDAIHPHVRSTTQAGGSQGSNWSFQQSVADGTNQSMQSTTSDGGSTSKQLTEGWAKSLGKRIANIFRPFREHEVGPRTEGGSWTRSTSSTQGESRTVTEGGSVGGSNESNWSQSQERLQSMLELADRSLERTITALHEAHGTGGYRWSAFVLADGENANLIGRALVGVLAGTKTKDFPFNRFELRNTGAELFQGTEPLLELVTEAAPILPLTRACEALLLPEAELPGVRLRRNVFLGRTSRPPDGGERVVLGPDAFSALTGKTSEMIEIPSKDLFRHLLVAGATGSGKTTRVVEILNRLTDNQLSVVVFETAKRTYRKRLQRPGRPAPWVYSLGSSREHPGTRFRPLRVNPFFFELGTSLKRHVAVLSDALAELMPTEAMIGPLMRRAVEATYLERGWDIELGTPLAGRVPSWPTVLDFAVQVRHIAQSLNYGPEVTANYRGALENRASLFVDATFQDIFGHGGNVPVEELFPPGCDAIIEVEDLPPSEVDIRAFVMTLVLSRLRAVQATAGSDANRARKWLVVVEEAHNVLDRSLEACRPGDESNAGRTLLRCIDRLLQEGREMELGVMVIDQSPANLVRSVISNTGTKIVMRLEDGTEMEEIGRAMGLEEEAWKKLGYLQEGEAIIKASFMDSPVKTARFEKEKEKTKIDNEAPAETEPPGPGIAPSYATLERLWQPVIQGTREPDDAWLRDVLAAAGGKPELAGFVGVKTQLEAYRNDPDALARTQELRAAVAEHPREPEKLLVAARSIFAVSIALANYTPLLSVSRLMFRALLLPSAPDPRARVMGLGLQRAAELLSLSGFGDVSRWRTLLLGVAGAPGPRWRDACSRFETHCHEVGRSDLTAPLRILLVFCAEAAKRGSLSAPAGRAVEPIEVVLQAQELLQPVVALGDGDSADPELMRRWQVLVEHLTREFALDLAARSGDTVATGVRELFSQGSVEDA
jgi:hypothetical protein